MASSDRSAAPAPATAPAGLLYEWRTYAPVPGGAGDLVRRLRRSQEAVATAGLLRPLGLWVEEIGSPGLVCSLWSFPGLEAREQALAAGEFLSEEGSGRVLDHVESVLWRITAYSPEPAVLAPVIELRTYDAAPGRLQALHDRFATFTVAAFARHGFENCGYWTEYFGRSGRLVYIVGFSSLEHRERAWRAFGQDPAWPAAREQSERDGPLIARHGARILRSARRRRPAPSTLEEIQNDAI
jgi:hypothetical protein